MLKKNPGEEPKPNGLFVKLTFVQLLILQLRIVC